MQRDPNHGAGEHAYQVLRGGILRGEYPPGTILAEAELANDLGVSRTPVREALQRLVRDELLEQAPRRQLIVSGVSPERRDEVLLLRDALEAVSVREACRRMTEEQLDQLRLSVFRQQRVARGEDVDAFLELDDEFHLAIAHAAGTPTLERFLGQLRAFMRLIGRDALREPDRVAQVLVEHESILDALEARDEVAALRAMHDHLEATARSVARE
ncbi:HTH-type transcriptional repressor RspR [Baekduia alba]|uniref:GntR family transcriptional regulator n=1 Tax=Baekduia alba TaxID=2997333 RepID=UPI00233F9AE6|nr:GntR family transcriptional regulator [Baekduia alba]WCB92265.1 HTH-type transcriptional repressor RspR [Baekduia alba]